MQRNGLLNYSPTVGKRDPAQVEAVQVQDVERMILQLAWRVADGKLDRIEVGVPSGFWTITSPSSTTLCAGILDAAGSMKPADGASLTPAHEGAGTRKRRYSRNSTKQATALNLARSSQESRMRANRCRA
jgi:hypothetical protein